VVVGAAAAAAAASVLNSDVSKSRGT